MMTQNEADDRSQSIWMTRPLRVQLRSDGGAHVAFDEPRCGSLYHRLDGNGHTVCHAVCRAREAEVQSLTHHTQLCDDEDWHSGACLVADTIVEPRP